MQYWFCCVEALYLEMVVAHSDLPERPHCVCLLTFNLPEMLIHLSLCMVLMQFQTVECCVPFALRGEGGLVKPVTCGS